MAESGELNELKQKWWKLKRDEPSCDTVSVLHNMFCEYSNYLLIILAGFRGGR